MMWFGAALIATAVAGYSAYRMRISERARSNIRYCIENIKSGGCEVTINRTNKEAFGDGYSVGGFNEGALNVILENFEEHVMKDFINRDLGAMSGICMDAEHHFFLRLFLFLDNQATSGSFYNNEMMSFAGRIDKFKCRYKLTNFGIVYYKVYLAAAAYCRKEKIYTLANVDGIKRIVDSGEVDIESIAY